MRACYSLVFVITVFLSVPLPLAHAQAPKTTPQSLEGDWSGTLKPLPSVELRLIFRIKSGPDGKLTATMESPDQGPGELPIDELKLDGDALTLVLKKINGTFTGKRTAPDVLDGTWSQGAGKLPLQLTRGAVALAPVMDVPAQLKGIWESTLKLPSGIELRLVLRTVEDKSGKLKLVLDSPDQAAKDIPVTSSSWNDGQWTWEIKSLGVKYSGKANQDGSAYDGTFTQIGQSFPLSLKRVEKITEPARPQNPKPPFPYSAREVQFENPQAKLKFSGTLTIPDGKGPFPAVVLITGSGPQDRDETLLGHKPFWVIADHLSRHGIAALRYDDRGVGGSEGSLQTSTSEDFASDVLSAIAFLRTLPEIRADAIGLIGHSEGGIIAPIAASRSHDVAFVVLLAGTGLPGEQILELQRGLILKAMGIDQKSVDRTQMLSLKIIEIARAEPDLAAAAEKARAYLTETAKDLPKAEQDAFEKAKSGLETQLKTIQSPWFRAFLNYDPRLALRQVKCPVLALNGEKDLQVPPHENIPEIQKALEQAGNKDVTAHILPGLNHLFQHSKTGSPSEYARIEETFDPEALNLITDWILARTRK